MTKSDGLQQRYSACWLCKSLKRDQPVQVMIWRRVPNLQSLLLALDSCLYPAGLGLLLWGEGKGINIGAFLERLDGIRRGDVYQRPAQVHCTHNGGVFKVRCAPPTVLGRNAGQRERQTRQ